MYHKNCYSESIDSSASSRRLSSRFVFLFVGGRSRALPRLRSVRFRSCGGQLVQMRK